MPLVNMNDVLLPAIAGKYAVGAFNTFNEDFTNAILSAAQLTASPLIISFSEVQMDYVDMETLALIIRNKAEKMNLQVVLHLDHGITFDTIVKALRYGFTSVMFDGSQLSFEENITLTSEIVKICKPIGVTVEAELGAVGGDEGGALESQANPELFTDPTQALEFVERTGVDVLAVAIGNAHGKYKKEPNLDFGRLTELKNVVPVPLALHGGTGISDNDFRKAISAGISKINFFSGMLLTAVETSRKQLKKCGFRYNDYLDVLAEVKRAVTEIVVTRINIFGSNNRNREA
jgi:fructose-bisphosphate aldolase class II